MTGPFWNCGELLNFSSCDEEDSCGFCGSVGALVCGEEGVEVGEDSFWTSACSLSGTGEDDSLFLSFSSFLLPNVLKKPGRRKWETCSSSDDVITPLTSDSILSASNGSAPF